MRQLPSNLKFLLIAAALAGCGSSSSSSSSSTETTVTVSGTVNFSGFTEGILRVYALDADVSVDTATATPTTLDTVDNRLTHRGGQHIHVECRRKLG